jgi:CheY-like chemotaxis protein
MDKKLSVLIIEDDKDLARLYRAMVSMVSYAQAETCSGANSGIEALERIKGYPSDIVFLDIHLPKVDGREILSAAQKDPRWKKTLWVIVTADVELGNSLMTSPAVNGVLIKPVELDVFHNYMEKAARQLGILPVEQLVEK